MKKLIIKLILFSLLFCIPGTAFAPIDNENKRRAVLRVLPIPDGVICQYDRRHIAGCYRASNTGLESGSEYTIGIGGDYLTYTAKDAVLGYATTGDRFTLVSDITDTVNVAGGGAISNRITFDGAGYTITGNVTFDENYWTIIDINVVGTLAVSGSYIIWR